MKLLHLFGSPREKGNCRDIANAFIDAAREQGADITEFSLNRMNYRGCQACDACKLKLDKCVLKDDMTMVLEQVKQTDVLLMSSPVYYGDVSAQLKGFIDRTYSFLVPEYYKKEEKSRLEPRKKMAMIIAQGYPDPDAFDDIFKRYSYFFKWMGFEECKLIRGMGVYFPGQAAKQEDLLEQARQTAIQLCS